MEYDINSVNRLIMGNKYLIKNKLAKLINVHRHMYQYILQGRFKEAFNLFYTIYYVPGGEGALQMLYRLGLDRFYCKFPQCAPIPRYVEIETTTICNKRCVFCEYVHWDKDSQVKRHLTLDEFKYMADQFPRIRWVNMTGEGSAFLNKDYWGMLRYLKHKYGTAIYLVDHLNDLDYCQIDELVNLVEGIYISMDGATKETYEKIKQGCSFDKVTGNIKYLINWRRKRGRFKPELHFRYIIVKDNIHEIPMFIDLINNLGDKRDFDVSTINFTGLLYFKGIEDHYVETIPEDIISEVRKRMVKGIYFRFEHTIEEYNPPLEKCYYWMEPYIMMGGYVLPCCQVLMSNRRPFLRKYSFGNVFEKSLKEIWNSERYRQFRRMVVDKNAKVPILCTGCRQFRTHEREILYGVDKNI